MAFIRAGYSRNLPSDGEIVQGKGNFCQPWLNAFTDTEFFEISNADKSAYSGQAPSDSGLTLSRSIFRF
jgi:hypothetical protein